MTICGICKDRKQEGIIFYATDDWLHFRLFVCDSCLDHTPMQQSLHELCYECTEHLPMQELGSFPDIPSRLEDLKKAIKGFEESHEKIFKEIPVSTDHNCTYPGSLHPKLREWKNKYKNNR